MLIELRMGLGGVSVRASYFPQRLATMAGILGVYRLFLGPMEAKHGLRVQGYWCFRCRRLDPDVRNSAWEPCWD